MINRVQKIGKHFALNHEIAKYVPIKLKVVHGATFFSTLKLKISATLRAKPNAVPQNNS